MIEKEREMADNIGYKGLDIGGKRVVVSYHASWEGREDMEDPFFVNVRVWAKTKQARKFRLCSVNWDGTLGSLFGYFFSFAYPPIDLYQGDWNIVSCGVHPVPEEKWEAAVRAARAKLRGYDQRLLARVKRNEELEALEPGSRERMDLAGQPLEVN